MHHFSQALRTYIRTNIYVSLQEKLHCEAKFQVTCRHTDLYQVLFIDKQLLLLTHNQHSTEQLCAAHLNYTHKLHVAIQTPNTLYSKECMDRSMFLQACGGK
jgi:hypothetical protein